MRQAGGRREEGGERQEGRREGGRREGGKRREFRSVIGEVLPVWSIVISNPDTMKEPSGRCVEVTASCANSHRF